MNHLNTVIIFPESENTIGIVWGTGEASMEEVAKRVVPANVPYLFVPINLLPTDRTFRPAWNADFSNPDGYGTFIG